MNCVNCGAALKPDAVRCIKCGSTVDRPAAPQPSQYSPPSQYPQSSPYQQPLQAAAPPPAYGAPVQAYPPPPPQVVYVQQLEPAKSKIAAGLLGLFLGVWGIHNFYLGRVGRGVVQLILSLTCYGMMITGPWAFIESILILAGSTTRDGRGRPLKD